MNPKDIIEIMPPITSWLVYGPLGLMFAIAMLIAVDRYFFVIRPASKAKASIDIEIQNEQREYTKTAKHVIERLAGSSERLVDGIAEVRKTQADHTDLLDDHQRRLESIHAEVVTVKVTLDGITKQA